jgi:hypothetical protein
MGAQFAPQHQPDRRNPCPPWARDRSSSRRRCREPRTVKRPWNLIRNCTGDYSSRRCRRSRWVLVYPPHQPDRLVGQAGAHRQRNSSVPIWWVHHIVSVAASCCSRAGVCVIWCGQIDWKRSAYAWFDTVRLIEDFIFSHVLIKCCRWCSFTTFIKWMTFIRQRSELITHRRKSCNRASDLNACDHGFRSLARVLIVHCQ